MNVSQQNMWDSHQSRYIFGTSHADTFRSTAAWSPVHTYPAGHELFRQGSWLHEVYMIERGLAKFTWSAPDGRAIVMGLFSRGALLGAAWVLSPNTIPSTVETLTKCHLCRMSASDFRASVTQNPQFSRLVHQWFSQALRTQILYLTSLKSEPARRRLERFLWDLVQALPSKDLSNQIQLHAPLKRWELAQLIDVTPEHLSRLFRELAQEETLRRERDTLILLNPKELMRRLGEAEMKDEPTDRFVGFEEICKRRQ